MKLDTAGQLSTYLLSRYRGSSERLTSRVQIRCKRASKDFEYFSLFLSNGYSLNLSGENLESCAL